MNWIIFLLLESDYLSDNFVVKRRRMEDSKFCQTYKHIQIIYHAFFQTNMMPYEQRKMFTCSLERWSSSFGNSPSQSFRKARTLISYQQSVSFKAKQYTKHFIFYTLIYRKDGNKPVSFHWWVSFLEKRLLFVRL